MSLIWKPAVASSFNGFSAAPQTVHVNALIGNPSFTIAGPVRGVRFRSPDQGAPGLAADSAIDFTLTTAQTGLVTQNAGWAPSLPVFPAVAQPGPFVKTQSGVIITLNSDGKLAQDGTGAFGYRLAKQNSNPISPEHEWITFEFSSPVTNVTFGGNFFNNGGTFGTQEGVSQLQVLTDSDTCCCPSTIGERCYRQEELQALFSTVNLLYGGGPGITPTGTLTGPGSQLIDQSLSGTPICGFTSPAVQFTDQTSPILEFVFPAPVDRLVRVQEYNQGGGILNDSDGFSDITLDFFDSNNALLHTQTITCGNGAQPFSFTLTRTLYNVQRIVWRNMRKLNPGSGVAPLAREFQAFYEPVRVAHASICDGEITWFDSETGDQVDPANFVGCDGDDPLGPIIMNGFVFNDAANEFICNVVPAPSTTSGWTPAAGNCFDPVVTNPSMTWVAENTVELEYGSAAGASGGAVVNFSTPNLGPFLWTTNTTQMAPGEQRTSLLRADGSYAVLTYVSGPPAASPSGTVDNPNVFASPPNSAIGLHRLGGGIFAPIRFRLEFFKP